MLNNYFFDLDGTICESKQIISKKMKEILSKLTNLIVISGATQEQISYQLNNLSCTILAQSGNDTPLWQNYLTWEQIDEIKAHVNSFYGLGTSNLQDRGCQASFSFTGHNAPIEQKKNFDPTGKIRQHILKKFPFKSKTLMVTVAGTTCLDYTLKKGNKGQNIKRWIKEKGLNKKDCIFFGDALFQGGNDESVKGIIKTISVENPQDLIKKLKKYE